MAREFLFRKVGEIGFVPPLPRWQFLIVRFHTLILSAIVAIIILMATAGLYSPLYVLLACSVYIAYALTSALFLHSWLYSRSQLWEFARGVVGLVSTLAGLLVFAQARDYLWLLLILPFWRILESDPHPPWGISSLGLLTAIGLYLHTSFRYNHPPFSPTFRFTSLKVLWLILILAMLYTYTSVIDRLESAERAKTSFITSLNRRMFRMQGVEPWCLGMLRAVLHLTQADYTTFQVVNHASGELLLVAAARRGQKGIEDINPLDLAMRLSFSDANSQGLTGRVLTTKESVAVRDVSQAEDYVRAFDDTFSEIAVPVRDLIHSRIGAVLNIEYTKPSAPQSPSALTTRLATLEEVAEQLAPVYSYVSLSDLRSDLKEGATQIALERDSQGVALRAMQTLSAQYRCPIGVWFRGRGDQAEFLRLEMAKQYPEGYARAHPKVPTARSVLGDYLRDAPISKQEMRLSARTVDHWRTIQKIKPPPRTMVLIPIQGVTQVFGVLQLFTLRSHTFTALELDLLAEFGHKVGITIGTLRGEHAARMEMLKQHALAAAHDFSTSTTHLRSSLDELLATIPTETPRARDLRESVETEIWFMQTLKDQILLPVTTSKALSLSQHQVKSLIKTTKNLLLSRELLDKERLSVSILPNADTVFSNRGVVIGALYNLLKNAIEADRRGNPIKLTSSVDTNQAFVNIDVRNRGPVISDEMRRQLFQPGFTSKETGLGIALGTYRMLLRQTGGSLQLLASDDLRGTIFRIQVRRSGEKND